VLDNWHKAAGAAQFDAYFNLMTADAIFIGTDATENWNKMQFQALLNPFLIAEKHGVLKLSSVIFMLINREKWLGLMSC
jgi:ketosteroid isomerase-like protein